jgi:hypothetical protein
LVRKPADSQSGLTRPLLNIEKVIIAVTDPDANFVHAVFPDIALRQEPFDIQDVCPDKLHGRGVAPPPEQVDVQRVVINGNGDMIVAVRVVVAGPATVFLQ